MTDEDYGYFEGRPKDIRVSGESIVFSVADEFFLYKGRSTQETALEASRLGNCSRRGGTVAFMGDYHPNLKAYEVHGEMEYHIPNIPGSDERQLSTAKSRGEEDRGDLAEVV